MGKQSASASPLRTGENKAGLARNSQGQARKRETSRRMEGQKAGYARGAQQRLETHYAGDVGKTQSWEVRAPELGVSDWERRAGPDEAWKMARYWAALIDCDKARIIAFGDKKFPVELRIPGSAEVLRFEVSGWAEWRYAANRVN
jgi:hypothetical protein